MWTVAISATIAQTLTVGSGSAFPPGSNTHNDLLQNIIWTLYRNSDPQFTWVGTAVLRNLQLYSNDQVTVVGHLPGGNTAVIGGITTPVPINVWMTGYSDNAGSAALVTPEVTGGQPLSNMDSLLVSASGILAPGGAKNLGLYDVASISSVELFLTGSAVATGVQFTANFYSDPAGLHPLGAMNPNYTWPLPAANGVATGVNVIIPAQGASMSIIAINADLVHSASYAADVFATSLPVDAPAYPMQPYVFTSPMPPSGSYITLAAGATTADLLTSQAVGGQTTFTLIETVAVQTIALIFAVDAHGNRQSVVWAGGNGNGATGIITGDFVAPGQILAVSIINQGVVSTQLAYSFTIAGTT